MVTILIQIYLIICTLFLAGKDASSYLMKNNITNDITNQRIKRWHRDGVVLNILFVIPLLYFTHIWIILLYALLIRLSFFDIAFNKWAGLDYTFLGSTSKVDQTFAKIFGQNGAVKKSMTFLAILVILNIFLK